MDFFIQLPRMKVGRQYPQSQPLMRRDKSIQVAARRDPQDFQVGDILRRIPGKEISWATLFEYLGPSVESSAGVRVLALDGAGIRKGEILNLLRFNMQRDEFLTAVRRRRKP